MQRSSSKGGQVGRSASIRSTASSNDGDKSERSRNAQNRHADLRASDSKKNTPEKSKVQPNVANDNVNNVQVPKRDRNDEDLQNRKKVKTTDSPCNPVTKIGRSIFNGLKSVFRSVFGSKTG